MTADTRVLYTVGHSNHAEETFVELLKQHEIGVLADVRSQPFSRYNSHFNDGYLKATLELAGIRYLFLGDQLGGRPDGDEFYDDEGFVLYHRLAESPKFLAGIERLESGIAQYRVAIMCSEEDPTVCHRHLLVTRVMDEHGINIQHIRGDGQLQSEDEVRPPRKQGLLFQEMEQDSWKSLRSVLPKPPPPSSSQS